MPTLDTPAPAGLTVGAVSLHLFSDPFAILFKRWNFQSAVLSSLFRAAIFFFVNLSAGPAAAVAAMRIELIFRCVWPGFYGALTEAFREAEPPLGPRRLPSPSCCPLPTVPWSLQSIGCAAPAG